MGISIHAPREGRDPGWHEHRLHYHGISIHAPREGRDLSCRLPPPSRGHFNPRAPRGARRTILRVCSSSPYFNPRAPRGARLLILFVHRAVRQISIHAPREGRDTSASRSMRCSWHFNPRAPRGARRYLVFFHSVQTSFQSTRPARGATAKVNKFLCTFLQKRHGFQISLRKTLPFKAFCRLQIGKNFSICGANRCGNFCELLLRTIRSSVLPEGRSACSQNAQFYSHTFSRDNRNADCLFPDP